MAIETTTLGTVYNPGYISREVSIPGATLILGGAIVGTYVGLQIGGPVGAAVGVLVGAFVGALAAGYIRRFRVILRPDGTVEVEYETRF
jgi:outer membrane lipoprotein SlyB